MILGSSECKTCSNVYLLSTGIFILVGVALIILLTLLNMTVSVSWYSERTHSLGQHLASQQSHISTTKCLSHQCPNYIP